MRFRGIVFAAIPLAFVVGCGSSSSSGNTASGATTDAAAPSLDAVTPSASSLQTWYQGGGKTALDKLTAALGAVANGNPADTASTRTACLDLGTTVSADIGYPPIPDQSIQAHWSAALAHFKNSSSDCVAGIDGNDTSLITLSGSEVDEGTSELKAADAALTGSS
jgi:hypothetical protein